MNFRMHCTSRAIFQMSPVCRFLLHRRRTETLPRLLHSFSFFAPSLSIVHKNSCAPHTASQLSCCILAPTASLQIARLRQFAAQMNTNTRGGFLQSPSPGTMLPAALGRLERHILTSKIRYNLFRECTCCQYR